MYLYSSTISRAAKNDSVWTSLTKSYPAIDNVINALTYQDRDMNVMYTRGPNTTVMFYLSTKIALKDGSHIAVHRTFPGVQKDSTTYDSSGRPWFVNAPQGSYYLYGPYIETFTRQPVITLSSMQPSTDSATGLSLNLVSGGVMLISELASIGEIPIFLSYPTLFIFVTSFFTVDSVEYPNGGFGVLFQKSTQQVLVWKDRSNSTVNAVTGTFKVVADFDPILASHSITTQSVFQYTDPQGITWIVAAYPFFKPGQANDPSNADNQFVILVFAKRSLAQNDLDSLNSNINSTINQIVFATIIIVACTVNVTMFLVLCVVEYITRPLQSMLSISEYIILMSAEDEDKKDYLEALHRAYINLERTDEVGLLAIEYFYIVGILNNKNMEKKLTPKYPSNPFHLGPQDRIDYEHLTWARFVSSFKRDNGILTDIEIHESKDVCERDTSGQVLDLDVLGSLTRQRREQASYALVPSAPIGETTQPRHIFPEPPRNNAHFVPIPSEIAKVGWFTSLKSQLYLLSAVLLFGVTFTMIFAVTSLSSQGSTWMSTSTIEIDNTQVINMRAITVAKSAFVKVLFYIII